MQVTQIAKGSDPSSQCSHLVSGNAKSFMTSCAAFGKRLPNCSCFCIDSAQRGKVCNLLVDLLTTRSLFGFHLAGLAHCI